MTAAGGWPEALHRLTEITGGSADAAAAAEEWLRQAIEATFVGRQWLHELTAEERALAYQKTLVVLARLGGDDLTFDVHQRAIVADAFEQAWGARLDGPPWRLAPQELDRPTYDEWGDAAAFT